MRCVLVSFVAVTGMPMCRPISVASDQSEIFRDDPKTFFKAASIFRDGYLLSSRIDRIVCQQGEAKLHDVVGIRLVQGL
jgi:hypothetical protein